MSIPQNDPENETVRHLNQLIQLDYDAILAYTQALENINLPDVRNHLANFRADHERHVMDLRVVVATLGGIPVEPKRDVKGFFLEKFTSIRSLSGNEGALKAMKMNEQLTNSTYAKALLSDLPAKALEVVQKNYDDEKRHLEYVERALVEKPWESKTRRAS